MGTAGKFKDPRTSTGASKFRKHSFEILPASASAKELFCCSSVSIMHLPCFFTEVNIKFSSKGNNVRRSIISTWPGNFFAAAFAQYTPIPYVTIQQLAPSFIFSSLAERSEEHT